MIPGRQLLEEDPAPDEFESYQKARDLYKSCIDEKTREELGVQPLVDKVLPFHYRKLDHFSTDTYFLLHLKMVEISDSAAVKECLV